MFSFWIRMKSNCGVTLLLKRNIWWPIFGARQRESVKDYNLVNRHVLRSWTSIQTFNKIGDIYHPILGSLTREWCHKWNMMDSFNSISPLALHYEVDAIIQANSIKICSEILHFTRWRLCVHFLLFCDEYAFRKVTDNLFLLSVTMCSFLFIRSEAQKGRQSS